MTMDLYTISGIDGSGKSTQVRRLIDRLTAAGERVEYFHAIQFSTAQRLRGGSSEPGSRDGVTSSSRAGVLARQVLLRVDVLRFRLLLRRLRQQGVTAVVSDRYFSDTVVHIAYLSGRGLGRARMPRPTSAVILNVPVDAVMQRDRAPEQGRDYLDSKAELYLAYAEGENLPIVNGLGDPDLVERRVADAIGR